MNLRDFARDKPCMVRVPGVCHGNPETTVLAHVRMIGISGLGIKSPDLFGAWACDRCHAWCDSGTAPRDRRQLLLLEGMLRTQAQLLKNDLIHIA